MIKERGLLLRLLLLCSLHFSAVAACYCKIDVGWLIGMAAVITDNKVTPLYTLHHGAKYMILVQCG